MGQSILAFDWTWGGLADIGLNVVGLIPGVGDLAKASKLGKNAIKTVDAVADVTDGLNDARKAIKRTDALVDASKAAKNIGNGAEALDTVNDARKALKNADEVGNGAKLATNATDTVETFTEEELKHLHKRLEELADEKLLPKYRAEDPDLVAGYRGSFQTGKVGNPNKPRYGQPIDRNSYDIDYWIESDILYEQFGGKGKRNKPKANQNFRDELGKWEEFKGLRAGEDGFSIKFLPKKGRKR